MVSFRENFHSLPFVKAEDENFMTMQKITIGLMGTYGFVSLVLLKPNIHLEDTQITNLHAPSFVFVFPTLFYSIKVLCDCYVLSCFRIDFGEFFCNADSQNGR